MLLWYRGAVARRAPAGAVQPVELQVESRRSPGRDDLALPSDVVVLTMHDAGGPPGAGDGQLDGDRLPVLGGVAPRRR